MGLCSSRLLALSPMRRQQQDAIRSCALTAARSTVRPARSTVRPTSNRAFVLAVLLRARCGAECIDTVRALQALPASRLCPIMIPKSGPTACTHALGPGTRSEGASSTKISVLQELVHFGLAGDIVKASQRAIAQPAAHRWYTDECVSWGSWHVAVLRSVARR